MLKMRLVKENQKEWQAIMGLPQFSGPFKPSFDQLMIYALEAEGKMRKSGLRKIWFDGARVVIVSGIDYDPIFSDVNIRVEVTLVHEYGDWWIQNTRPIYSRRGWINFYLPTDIPKPEKVGFFGRIRKLLEAL